MNPTNSTDKSPTSPITPETTSKLLLFPGQGSHSGMYGGWLVVYLVGGLLFVWMIWSWWQLLMHCNRLEYRQGN